MTAQYVLYKNPIQLDTLAIVRYLHALGHNAQPTSIVERNHPVATLPAIQDLVSGQMHVGWEECVRFYERRFGVDGLAQKSADFCVTMPEYRVSERRTRVF